MDKKINLSQLADLMAEAGGMSKVASEQFVKNFFDIISKGVLDEGIVKVKGFGTFKLLQMEDRESVNVNTGERFTIEGHQKISFTPDAELKERINKPFSAFETVVITEEQASELSDVEISKDEPQASESDDAEATIVEESVTVEGIKPVEPQVKEITQKRGTRIFLKFIISLLSIILALGLALYLLWPIVGDLIPNPFMGDSRKPAVEAVKPAAKESKPVIEEAMPETEEAQPVIEEAQPAVQEVRPTVEEAKPTVEEAKPVIDAPKPVVAEPKPAAASDAQAFSLNKEDQAKALSQFTEADTVNYRIVGRLAVHTLEEGETLTKIAQKYYGTKKLWPYLVKYNNLGSFNKLNIGSKINIP